MINVMRSSHPILDKVLSGRLNVVLSLITILSLSIITMCS